MLSNPALFLMMSVEPFTCKSCLFLNSPKSLVTVSRRCSDHLGNLFMREHERNFYLTLSVVTACGKVQQEAGQLLAHRMGESNGPHFCDCGVIGFTQLLRDANSTSPCSRRKFRNS